MVRITAIVLGAMVLLAGCATADGTVQDEAEAPRPTATTPAPIDSPTPTTAVADGRPTPTELPDSATTPTPGATVAPRPTPTTAFIPPIAPQGTAAPEPTLPPGAFHEGESPPTPTPGSSESGDGFRPPRNAGIPGRDRYEIPSAAERELLPACEPGMLTEAFLDLSSIASITPLGSLTPPGHTLPTEHVYINPPRSSTGDPEIPLRSPGDVWVTQISGDGSRPSSITIHFAICKEVYGYFNHVDSVSPLLQGFVDALGCPPEAEVGTQECTGQVFERIDAATPIGAVRTNRNFDLGIWDIREHRFTVNPERYGSRSLFIRCGLEYFAEPLSASLMGLLHGDGAEPCGTISHDVAGTAQGVWFLEGDGFRREELAVFLGYDNVVTGEATVSLGGTLTEFGKMGFTPTNSGLINRFFDQVTADGHVYCYERDGTGYTESFQNPGPLIEGHILVQVVSDTEARMEHGDGSCANSGSMQNPLTYLR